MVSLSNHARLAFHKPVLRMPTVCFDTLRTNGWHIEGLRLNGWFCNSFSITNARVNNPRDYAWLVQRESIGYPD